MVRHAFGHSARVHKHECGPVRLDQLREAMIDFLPNFIRHHRLKWRLRKFNRHIQFAAMTDVDDFTIRIASLVHRMRSNQKTRYFFNRFLRRGQTDSLKLSCGGGFRQRGQTLHAQGKMSAASVIHHSMYLVQNERSGRAQYAPARFGSEQEIQRFRRGHENVRRFFDQRPALRGSCIASANFCAHIDVVAFGFTQQCANSSERFLQVFPDIVAQGFEGRDVNDLRFIGQINLRAFSEQHIQRSKKRSQRFTGTGRRRNQHVPAGLNRRPAQLRFRR